MEFCLVPEGPFWMGSGPDDRDADDRERPLHEVRLPAYWIARYPVTVAQFAEYVAHSGHKPGDRDSLQGMPNHPVVWVSWRETVAFCEWLTKDWQAKGRIPPRWRVRLPSEAEWEKAARGGTRIPQALDCMALPLLSVPAVDLGRNEVPYRRFPWGDEQPDADRANCSETGIGDTSAVGSFPKGTSPYGCEDMAGNAYEWTRSRYTKSGVDPGDGADLGESPQKGDYAVVRGGAFWLFPTLVRCACRNWDGPLVRGDCCGFRVVLSPFLRS
jgi:formylglycine-generating enzyme required for sulfatase activity